MLEEINGQTLHEGPHYVKKPETKHYVQLYLPAQQGPMAQQAIVPCAGPLQGKTIAMSEPAVFAFRHVTRDEVMIDNRLFSAEPVQDETLCFFGKPFSLGEIAIMGPDLQQMVANMKQGKFSHAVLTRLGNWQPLRECDKCFDPETGHEIIVGKGAPSGIILS